VIDCRLMLTINTKTGLIDGARQLPSPNYDDRPPDCEPELIIIHGISLPPGEFGGPYIDHLFTNSLDPDEHPYFAEIVDARVSSHLLIERNGQIVQYVSLNQRAWHAGESCFHDRDCCNDFSIGIELEGTDTDDYTDAQYDALCDVVRSLRTAFDSLERAPIVGHSDVAPGRKTDPGPAFDWARFEHRLDAGGVKA
jgi:AmpD protein